MLKNSLEDIALANAAAALDPDGQVFPWVGQYPLAGQIVQWQGELWTCLRIPNAYCGTDDSTRRNLVSVAHDIEGLGHETQYAIPCSEMRPAAWTKAKEDLFVGRACRVVHVEAPYTDDVVANDREVIPGDYVVAGRECFRLLEILGEAPGALREMSRDMATSTTVALAVPVLDFLVPTSALVWNGVVLPGEVALRRNRMGVAQV